MPSTALITLILDNFLSTLRTCTFSVPMPRISFSLIAGYPIFPVTSKVVTIPVTPSVPRPDDVEPTPLKVRIFDEIPTV